VSPWGTLARPVPGHRGLGIANPRGEAADKPVQIAFLGTALTVRDLVSERTIFWNKPGLSATAYLGAKIVAVHTPCGAIPLSPEILEGPDESAGPDDRPLATPARAGAG
jgi:hypothetical protein